ncbi:hypothetical protein D3C78_1638140 [compost metagenome]
MIEQLRAGQLRHAGRGLDAITALGRQPEEAFAVIVPADHQIAVGDERAQAGPAVSWAADGQGGGGFDVVDPGGDVQLFGHHVLWRDGIGVGRRAQQLAGVRFEVKAFVDADHRRPA